MKRTIPALTACLLFACAAGTPPPVTVREAAPVGPPTFGAWETSWLGQLGATDPRLATRTGVKPSADEIQKLAGAAVVRGDAEVGTLGGGIDLFSFAVRDQELHRLGVELVRQPDDGSRASRDEKILLGKLLEGEELRVARERAMPEAASERVRGILATWRSASSGREVVERERLLARGLTEAVTEAGQGALSRPRVLELDDALDALEREAVPEGYPEATKLITRLRMALGSASAGQSSRELPASLRLSAQLQTYLGGASEPHEVTAHLREAESVLAGDVKSRLRGLPDSVQREAMAAAAPHVDEESPCPAPRAVASMARAMRPPPERALDCEALILAAAADAPEAELIATIVLHDDVAIALWALALDEGATDLDATRATHRLIAAVPRDQQDRLVRAALVAPVRAIAPGVAASMLDSEGPSERRARAVRWLAYGDGPFDAVAEALRAR